MHEQEDEETVEAFYVVIPSAWRGPGTEAYNAANRLLDLHRCIRYQHSISLLTFVLNGDQKVQWAIDIESGALEYGGLLMKNAGDLLLITCSGTAAKLEEQKQHILTELQVAFGAKNVTDC